MGATLLKGDIISVGVIGSGAEYRLSQSTTSKQPESILSVEKTYG